MIAKTFTSTNVYRLTFLLLAILLVNFAYGQNAEIRGVVYQGNGDETVPGAYIQILQNGNVQYITGSNDSGQYQIKNIIPGEYLVRVTNLYEDTLEVKVGIYKLQLVDLRFKKDGEELKEIVLRRVDSEHTTRTGKEKLKNLPSPNPNDGLRLQPNIRTVGDRIVVGPNRPDATQVMQDGLFGTIISPPPTTLGLEGVEVFDQAIRARYGGFSGGAVMYRTANIGMRPVTTYQFQSSSLFNGYHHNMATLYLSRSLMHKEYEEKKASKLIFGFSFLGYYKYQRDPNPTAADLYVVNDRKLDELNEDPFTSSEQVGGFVPSSNFLSDQDFTKVNARPNAARQDGYGQLKFTLNPSPYLAIDLISTYSYQNRRLPLANNLLLNSDENPLQTQHSFGGQLNINHTVKRTYDHLGRRLTDENELFSNIFYNAQVNYQVNSNQVRSNRHLDDLFSYGYVGQFNTKKVPVYNYAENKPITYIDQDGNQKQVRNYHEFTGYRDSLISFIPDSRNPGLSGYTDFLYGKGNNRDNISNLVQSGGILNGFNMPTLYSLYSLPGTVYGNYSKSFQERFALAAYMEAAFHPFKNPKIQHDLEFGVSYQQDRSGYYSLSASRLWQLMPLLANTHINSLDKSNPILGYDENGRFIDTVRYNTAVNYQDQTDFDKALREKLINAGYRNIDGKTIGEDTWIDVNSLSPETFDINMFSAEDLLNNGNSYVAYSGYDHLGNRTKGRAGIGKFLNDPNRSVDAFMPSSGAVWLEDKFVFKELIVRAGVRFERYDGNQYTLKDPYLVFPAKTAGEVSELQGREINHPEGIGEDYVVYVNNANSPTDIVGYRSGNQWFDKGGNKISDPSLISQSSTSRRIQPYLIDPENQKLTSASFKKSEAQNLLLPRLSFSFPLNSSSLFFVSYDQLAQQPASSQTFLPYTSYYFLQSNISGVLPNPDMKPRVKTDYNFGLTQLLGDHASLRLMATYGQIKNDFNQFRVEQAYPYSYTTFSNIDVATIQQYTAVYDHSSEHTSLNLSYVLQFAEGTGSNVNSAASLIQSGQPNLRSLFPLSYENRHTLKGSYIYQFRSGKRYAGPEGVMRKVLSNAMIAGTFTSFSGNPYTATQRPISEAQASNGVVQRTQIEGNPFGNRMPWKHQFDLRIEKGFVLRGEKMMQVYLTAANLFNNLLVENVYSFTGLAGDDGYLNSPQGRQAVQEQLSAETFTRLYKMRMDNPNNLGTPRNIQVGVILNL
jgi:hypothetical protein